MESLNKVMQLPADSHGGTLADCAYSHTGDRMVTCSTSGTVQVLACSSSSPGGPTLLHSAKVPGEPTKSCWAPEELGSVVAVATSGGAVHILRTGPGGGWAGGGELACGRGAVRDLAFAPAQHGLVLAAASEDGGVYLYEGALWASVGGGGGGCSDGPGWTLLARIDACEGGPCQCVSWRPFTAGVPPLLLAASARGAKAWCHQQAAWRECGTLQSPGGEPAVALSWAPALGAPHELAAASFGATVAVFRLAGAPTALSATRAALLRHPRRVWRVEFSEHGGALGCGVEGAGAALPEVWLFMPDLGGNWRAVSRIVGGGSGGGDA